MQSKRKSNTVVTHELVGNSAIKFTVGTSEFLFTLPERGTANHDAAAIHGFVQKISDRAAIGRDPETGASASPEEKFAAMKECAERLMAGGPWNAVATGTGSAGGLLYRAMRALYPNAWTDRTTFAAYLEEKAISETAKTGGFKDPVSGRVRPYTAHDVSKGLMAVKRVSKEIERIRVEEGKSVAINAADMLQELEGAK